jgi:integrase
MVRVESAVRDRRPGAPTPCPRRQLLDGAFRLVGELLYGSGLRLLECLAMRVKDGDLERRQITVRHGKGERDPAALLPARTGEGLRAQLDRVAARHRAEVATHAPPPCTVAAARRRSG